MRMLRTFVGLGSTALLFGALGLVGLALSGPPAGAQMHTISSLARSQQSLSQLAPGLDILGASITGSGPQSGRTLDSSQANAFVQAWLPDSVFGSPPFQNPPPALPVYQLDVDYRYQGTPGSMTVYYASDGTSAWVSMPPQTLWPGVVVTQQRWIEAPDRTVAGFEGRLTPVTVPNVPASSHQAVAATASHGSSSTTQLLIIAGVVVVVAGIGILAIRRRGGHSTRTQTT